MITSIIYSFASRGYSDFMKTEFVKWFVFLIVAILLSSFLHEVGHGLSAYSRGYSISTGFNKVGDYNKKPSDINFRKQHNKYKNPWDMGPLFTLILATLFTYLIFQVNNKFLIYLFGSLAFVNSLLRLIPMIRSYLSLINTGSLAIEDEIAMGTLWYQMSDILILKYVPSIISIIVSVLCLKYVLKVLKMKLPELFPYRWSFTVISVSALLVAIPLINFLDQNLRINWG
jgi:hypothetical protein